MKYSIFQFITLSFSTKNSLIFYTYGKQLLYICQYYFILDVNDNIKIFSQNFSQDQ
ncbi:hypothetical protein pb186bvf_015122 [Paramecium bursaria]